MLEKIRMLCHCGAGLQAISSPFCAAVREMIDTDAGLLVWIGLDGLPAGFYHESAPPEIKDLFVSRFEELFDAGEEISAFGLINGAGPAIGKMLGPGMQDAFARGNIHRHLCVPLGHHYLFDMVVPGRAAYFAFNAPGRPFDQGHAKALEPVLPLMAAALESSDRPAQWCSLGKGGAHLVASLDGRQLLVIDEEAERLLCGSHLLRQNLGMLTRPRAAPGFVTMLAASAGQGIAEIGLPVPDGRLLCKVRRTRLLPSGTSQGDEALMIGLDLQFVESVAVIDCLFEKALTGLQREIALYAIEGGNRSECQVKFGVGAEALKKHLQVIYRECQVDSWNGLGALYVEIIKNHALNAEARWSEALQ
ncbi:MAG: hypothetical protein ABL928_00660 [Sphingorhabdus sp.]